MTQLTGGPLVHDTASRTSTSRLLPGGKGQIAGPQEDFDAREQELVEAARDGDRRAFGELYAHHHTSVYRMARAHLHEGADAATAETFLRAWKGLPAYRHTERPFGAWLYGLAHDVVCDELRRRQCLATGDAVENAARDVQDDRLVLADAIGSLPHRQRTVIEMKYLFGFTNEEISKAVGKTPAEVNATQWRGLRALCSLLGAR